MRLYHPRLPSAHIELHTISESRWLVLPRCVGHLGGSDLLLSEGVAMKYAKLDVLADMPQEKTICVEFDELLRTTQVHTLVLNDLHRPSVLVTVIVKNARLTDAHVRTLAEEFLLGKLPASGGFFNAL